MHSILKRNYNSKQAPKNRVKFYVLNLTRFYFGDQYLVI